MPVLFVRPPVADLIYRLYDRPLHPELFDALATRRADGPGYAVTVRLTPTGHALTWTDGAVTLCEVTAAAGQELPAAGKLAHRFGGGRGGRCRVGDVRYQVSSHVEVLPAEQFAHVHEELRAEGAKKGFLCHFRPGNRLGLSPLGVVIAEVLPGGRGLSVRAFHTFPDELAVVKTQSLIERA